MAIQTVTPGSPLTITLSQGSFFNLTVPYQAAAKVYRTGADGTPVVESIVSGPVTTKIGPHLSQVVHVIEAIRGSCTVEDTTDVGTGGGSASAYKTLSPTLTKWKAARSRGAASPAKHVWLTDSNGAAEGAGGGTFGLDAASQIGFVNKFADLLGHRADGTFGDSNVSAATVQAETFSAYDTRWTMGSGWASDTTPAMFGGAFLKAPAAAAGLLTGNILIPCDTIDYYYPQNAAGCTAQVVRIDGNIVDTINQAGASANIKKTYSVALGTHTFSVSGGATGASYFHAIVPRIAATDTPLSLRGAWCAAKIALLAATTSPWSPFPFARDTLVPDFTSIYCTINDSNSNTTVSAFRISMESIVAGLAPTSDGCLFLGFPSSSANTAGGLLDQYAITLQTLASDYGWGFFDSRTFFGSSNAQAQARGLRFDTDHPNLAGHTGLANAYFQYLKSAGFN